MAEMDLRAGIAAVPRYRSLITFVDSDPRSEARLQAAIEMARLHDAHLTALVLRYDQNLPPYAYGAAVGASMIHVPVASREEAEQRAAEVKRIIEAAGVRGITIPREAMFRDIQSEVAVVARYADIAIVGSPKDEEPPYTASDILDGVLYETDLPALLLPEKTAGVEFGTVLIGWDGSRQALKAVKGALPFLQRADRVEICIFDPKRDGPGESLAAMLSRHDVKVEIAALPRPMGSIAEALANRAREIGAGLLVMGAYGHSRFRESIIGGVTREILEDVSMPVLLAH